MNQKAEQYFSSKSSSTSHSHSQVICWSDNFLNDPPSSSSYLSMECSSNLNYSFHEDSNNPIVSLGKYGEQPKQELQLGIFPMDHPQMIHEYHMPGSNQAGLSHHNTGYYEGMHSSGGVPLPGEAANYEPIYVNAKQYHGILRRRQSRAKAELENRVAKARKACILIRRKCEYNCSHIFMNLGIYMQ
ncbi:hypothetical protein BVRB_3g061350 isoform B [Beta vulgaris subsp. vulgaris]|uniref:nuclear transcription factor Y subunit A-9 isoform X2 n=1 Tax=Beta vulgaris subsp. vulgaris TaxID=3555 RepID=UPI00053F48A4|nr:nuclear transcription factor Y subunit A-9 isoform X2 [Beta vulgaris subsp. vulgaris]KMT15431.1 hypothetical protein BVRB_3g061350 isoform B [Beta vulgaris subsp. vulgaris]